MPLMFEVIKSTRTMNSLLLVLLCFLSSFFLLSCTATAPYKAYQGEQLSSTEVSTLKNTLRISPTGDDQIKISHIDQVKMPGFQSAFQILPGHHQISACYSEAYQEKSILDSWFGKFCSIHGTFSFDYEFIKSHTYELSIKPINKSFAYQEIKVFMVDRTQRTQMEVEVFEKSLSLDCTQEEPNLLSYIVSKCN